MIQELKRCREIGVMRLILHWARGSSTCIRRGFAVDIERIPLWGGCSTSLDCERKADGLVADELPKQALLLCSFFVQGVMCMRTVVVRDIASTSNSYVHYRTPFYYLVML